MCSHIPISFTHRTVPFVKPGAGDAGDVVLSCVRAALASLNMLWAVLVCVRSWGHAIILSK